jgi:hypothetical protein
MIKVLESRIEIVGDPKPQFDLVINVICRRDRNPMRDSVALRESTGVEQSLGDSLCRFFEGQAEIDARSGCRFDRSRPF